MNFNLLYFEKLMVNFGIKKSAKTVEGKKNPMISIRGDLVGGEIVGNKTTRGPLLDVKGDVKYSTILNNESQI